MRPYDAGTKEPPVLTYNYAELPLQLWSPSRSAEVFHLALRADLDQVVEIFAAVSPCPSDETQQVSKALEPCHKCAGLTRRRAPHLLVQPL